MTTTNTTSTDLTAQGPLTAALRQEFAQAFRMFKDVVERLDEVQWLQGDPTWMEVPAAASMHTLVCAEFYIATSRYEYEWEPNGVSYWNDPPEKLPGPKITLTEIERVAAQVDAYVEHHGDVGLLQGHAETAGQGQSRVQWMVYALRHLQHHVSQMSADCKRRGLGAAAWE